MQFRKAIVVGISVVCFLCVGQLVQADDPKATATKSAVVSEAQMAALKAADDARTAAMMTPQRERLDAVFSNDLHYAHSTGTVDTKSSFIEVLTSGKTKYLGFEYEKRDFTFPAPGIALMTGRVKVRVTTAEANQTNLLSFLAAYRLENGNWRFLAWQSCKVPPPQ